MLLLSSRLTTFRSLFFFSFVSFFSYDLQVKFFNISCDFFPIHPHEKKSLHFSFVYFAFSFFLWKTSWYINYFEFITIFQYFSFAHQGQSVHKYFFNRCFVFLPLLRFVFIQLHRRRNINIFATFEFIKENNDLHIMGHRMQIGLQ